MSFVCEVLSADEKAQIENINKKVPDVVFKINEYKQDVMKYVENVYVKYSERPKYNKILLSKANDLLVDMNSLETNIKNITQHEVDECLCKLCSYKEQLDEVNHALKISSQVIEIHETFELIEELQTKGEFIEAMKKFNETEKYVSNLNKEDHVEVLKDLEGNIVTAQFKLVNKLTNIFRDNVSFNENMPHTLQVTKHSEEVEKTLQALTLYKPNIHVLDKVTKFLWKYVFCPIVMSKSTVEIDETNDINSISVNVVNVKEKDNYKDIFDNIIKVLDFLQVHFKFILQEDVTTLSYIGNDIRDNVSELLIKECLNNTIPSTSEELRKYDAVIAECEVLQSKLVDCEIFKCDTTSILDHASNIDVLFINKKCQEYLNSAISLMKRDLHDLVEVGTPHDINNTVLESSDFPQCSISKSCIELSNLIEKIIEVTAVSSDLCAGRLFCTIQNILHMYGNVVHDHNQKLLQTIPQQVSLFHNNCMYLAYKLVSWSEICKQKLPPVLHTELAMLYDKANILKTIGNSVFIGCIQQQTKQIEEILNDAGVTSVSTLEKLEPTTEKCIRQCLRQQELLKTVWHKVLCYSDYNRSIGYILNSMCNFIITGIIKLEDISAEASEQLVDIFKVILTRGPKLFSDPKEIHLYVENWYKMNELVFLLNSSLIDIDDRWADGKGPLALQFQPEEIKRIIRALFQNTDKRSAVLAKI